MTSRQQGKGSGRAFDITPVTPCSGFIADKPFECLDLAHVRAGCGVGWEPPTELTQFLDSAGPPPTRNERAGTAQAPRSGHVPGVPPPRGVFIGCCLTFSGLGVELKVHLGVVSTLNICSKRRVVLISEDAPDCVLLLTCLGMLTPACYLQTSFCSRNRFFRTYFCASRNEISAV